MKTVYLLVLSLVWLALTPTSGAAQTVSPAALAANNQGAAAFAKGDFLTAITAFRKAIQLAPDQPVIVESLAASYQKLGRWTEAQTLLQAKIKAFRAPDQKTELEGALADNHFYWAQKLKAAYQYQEAIQHLQAALAIDRAFRPSEVGVDLYALGSVSDDLTQYAKAIDYYQEALKLRQASGDRSGEADVLNNLGSLYDNLGQYANAIDFYGQALAIERDLKDRAHEAATLNNSGSSWNNAGQPEKAIGLHEQSLKICREIKDREGEAVALKSLGSTYDALG
ncbi:MAG: tetratricopeptide repeat protein, partial [Armatimonadota bacterium]|nr:tetratricopeptide repeat protein [Armatimonadota bacterium]